MTTVTTTTGMEDGWLQVVATSDGYEQCALRQSVRVLRQSGRERAELA